MKDRYDVVVVGAGPAGSWAARHAALGGADVLLLEKDREIGLPVRCAEGVTLSFLEREIPLDPAWVAQVVTRAVIYAPDGRAVEAFSGEKGVILHRRLFDAALAGKAAEAGAEVVTKAYVFGLLMGKGRVVGVHVRHLGKDRTIRCSLVIGADGIESRVGRWAGIPTHIPLSEMEACVQMTLCNLAIDPETVCFWLGREVAPQGYLWLFPKGKGWANVGLGISGTYAQKKKAIAYLREFVDRTFPKASILGLVAGGVPTAPALPSLVGEGVLLVGDAGRQIDPLSGGGILNALIGGRLAGQAAAEALKSGDFSKKFLHRYQKAWDQAKKKELALAYRIKRIVYGFSDEDLNRIADVVLTLPLERRTNFEIFKAGLKKHPGLILQMARLWV